MVSRLLGKLEVQRQRTEGSAGACATACAAAVAEKAAMPPWTKLRRSRLMDPPWGCPSRAAIVPRPCRGADARIRRRFAPARCGEGGALLGLVRRLSLRERGSWRLGG